MTGHTRLRVGIVGASVGASTQSGILQLVRDHNARAVGSWGPLAHVPAIKEVVALF